MTPQPLASLKPGGAKLSIGTVSVNDTAEELAALVGRVIGMYAAVEVELTKFVTSCLVTDYIVAAEILNALERHSGARERAIASIVARAFQDRAEEHDLVTEVLKRAKGHSKVRNRLAHHFWATAPERPDVLVLIPPSAAATSHGYEVDLQARQPQAGSRRVYTAEGDLADRLTLKTQQAVYYSAAELAAYVEEFQDTARYLQWVEQLVNPSPVLSDARERLEEAFS